MSNRRLRLARMGLAQAVTRSSAENSRATRRLLASAARRAHMGGAHEVGDRIDTLLGRDVRTPQARKEMRECMQLLDVALHASAIFEPASGGAEL